MKLVALMGVLVITAACGGSPLAPTSPSGATGGTLQSNSSHPPGQHPSGNPAQAPGCSNPNTVPSSDCKKP
jgi:hypothetical protein